MEVWCHQLSRFLGKKVVLHVVQAMIIMQLDFALTNARAPFGYLHSLVGLLPPLATVLYWLGLRNKPTEEEQDPVVIVIKRGILCMQRHQYNQSEQLFHMALIMAQERADQRAETYIFDQMANLAYQQGQLDKAFTLFTTVVGRMIAQGLQDNDNPIIEMSVKLANILSQQKQDDKALVGYNHCLKAQLAKTEGLEPSEELEPKAKDDYLLLAMTYSSYGKHLLNRFKYQLAQEQLEKALEITEKICGLEHPQTLVLMNDLGTTMALQKNFEKAQQYIAKAIEVGDKMRIPETASFRCNLGMFLLMDNKPEEAIKLCRQSLKMANKLKDLETKQEAQHCLDQINLNRRNK
ncbi:SLC25A26 [Cordylochernes scorpioides]|uniref:SLC25A26 n=1 Tax=Cordylochernes scorpioides TaxID=51811 RepID=A0ABY6LGC3_9ARAC|nr:SLC25A26 [Cordylochernes scorpioides]